MGLLLADSLSVCLATPSPVIAAWGGRSPASVNVCRGWGGAHLIREEKLRLLRQRLPLTLLKCAPAGLVELIFLPRATTPPSGACDLDPGAASFQTAFDMQ